MGVAFDGDADRSIFTTATEQFTGAINICNSYKQYLIKNPGAKIVTLSAHLH